MKMISTFGFSEQNPLSAIIAFATRSDHVPFMGLEKDNLQEHDQSLVQEALRIISQTENGLFPADLQLQLLT